MFSFFKKKSYYPQVNDMVFATKEGKWKSLLNVANQISKPVFIAWFEDSKEQLQQYFQQHQTQVEVMHYRQVHANSLPSNAVIFIEHYPLLEKETSLFSSLIGKNIAVYSSLDEPLFKIFGGENISALLTKMGLANNEAISHSMITRSIRNAQEKLSKKVTTEHSATSIEDWMRKNVEPTAY